MTIRTLQLDLGTLDPPAYTTGWYRDPDTGQYYYYNASTKTWYIYAAGILTVLEVPKEPAPKTVDIAAGDTLRIQYSYKYSGPAITVTEYVSIGYTVLGVYDEIVYKSKSRSLPESAAPATYDGSLDVVMPTPAETKWNDIQAKVFNGGKELGLVYLDALNVVTPEPEFTEFSIVDYAKV